MDGESVCLNTAAEDDLIGAETALSIKLIATGEWWVVELRCRGICNPFS
jgi:hypothetical protein